jgi:hypothetical protein
MWIGVVLALFGRQWWTHERDRRLIVAFAALFCVIMGVTLAAISVALGREEYGFGTLFGGPHAPRVLIFTTLTGLLGLIQLGLGIHLTRLVLRRAV